MLVEATERLSFEFPTLPLGVVARCVQAARVTTRDLRPADLATAVEAVERIARDDLGRIAEAITGQAVTS
jgi:hypothetical protein